MNAAARAIAIVLMLTAGPLGTTAAVFATPAAPLLVDQRGHGFTLSSLIGKPLAITFVSAHCTDACPLIDAQFAAAAQRLARARADARLLTVTLDPAHDPPRLMRALAQRFDADPRYWLVAGGTPHDVAEVLQRFGVLTQTGKNGYREAHTTFVYIVDERGQLRRTMLASTDLASDVVEALEAVVR